MLQPTNNFISRQIWQPDVDQHGIELIFSEEIERTLAVARHDDVSAFELEEQPKAVADMLHVIHDQNPLTV